MLEKLENQVIHIYGFEHKITILVFKLTEILKKL